MPRLTAHRSLEHHCCHVILLSATTLLQTVVSSEPNDWFLGFPQLLTAMPLFQPLPGDSPWLLMAPRPSESHCLPSLVCWSRLILPHSAQLLTHSCLRSTDTASGLLLLPSVCFSILFTHHLFPDYPSGTQTWDESSLNLPRKRWPSASASRQQPRGRGPAQTQQLSSLCSELA